MRDLLIIFHFPVKKILSRQSNKTTYSEQLVIFLLLIFSFLCSFLANNEAQYWAFFSVHKTRVKPRYMYQVSEQKTNMHYTDI